MFTVIPLLIVATSIFRRKSARGRTAASGRRSAPSRRRSPRTSPACGSLQAFTRERAARENFRTVSEAYRRKNHETVVQNALYFPFVDLLSSRATAIVLGYGGYLVFDGHTTIGVLTAFLGYLTNFFDPVQQLSQLYSTFLSAVAALDKIMEVLVEEPQVTDAPGAIALAGVRGHVRFDDVCASGTRRAPRCCTGSTSTCRPGRRWRSSVTRAPASRRSPS